ncbi:hypothetical protein CHS0354_003792 [Potamilus streckersoni]|uniref:Uncharacterized protein n=1 Tax=Potamilus streckersoni TaxID=2493646 RepID=A0AAE0T2C1_9BIVA|nr:hypothetical protein CHS0354_003792 [Potamilus streckersoni]
MEIGIRIQTNRVDVKHFFIPVNSSVQSTEAGRHGNHGQAAHQHAGRGLSTELAPVPIRHKQMVVNTVLEMLCNIVNVKLVLAQSTVVGRHTDHGRLAAPAVVLA